METKKLKCPITKKEYLFSLIRVDANKNKWWALEDPENIPALRLTIFLSRVNKAEMGLDEAFIKTSMNLINQYAKDGNLDAVKAITNSFTQRSELRFNSRALVEAIYPLLLLNDENLTSYGSYNDKQKTEALDKDTQTEDFFLSWAVQLCKEYSQNLNKSDLQELIQKEKVLNQYLNNTMNR